MAVTPFNRQEYLFSQRAHEGAMIQWYPYWRNDPDIVCERSDWWSVSDKGRVLDGQMAVDCCLQVLQPGHPHRRTMTVQERFRRTRYQHFRDITITYRNRLTNQPSEAFKSTAQWMVYGFWDDTQAVLHEAWSIRMQPLLDNLFDDTIPSMAKLNQTSQQEFRVIRMQHMFEHNLIHGYLLPPVTGQPRRMRVWDAKRGKLGDTVPCVKETLV